MRAFRSAGSIFKRLTGRAAEEAKLKVEFDISPSHPKNVIRFCIHPGDEEKTKKMVAGNPSRMMEWLANVNFIAASGDLLWKSGKALLKVKEGGVKEAVKEAMKTEAVKEAMKTEACSFSPQSQELLASLIEQSEENAARLGRVELLAEHIAKHGVRKGSPPPPLRPPAPPANGNSNGKKGKGKGNGDGEGDGNGKGGGDGNGKGGGDGNGKWGGDGNGKGGGDGNGGPPAENGTLPEPFDYPIF